VAFLALAGWALKIQFFGPLRQYGSAFYPDYFKNHLAGFITPDAFELLHTAGTAAAAKGYVGGVSEYVSYLGIPLLAAVLIIGVVFWRRLPARVCVVTGVAMLVLSLGAHPLVALSASSLTQNMHAAKWPWGWLENLPAFGAMLPSRLSVVADGAVGGALAFGIDLTWAWLRRIRVARQWATTIVSLGAIIAVLPLVPVPYQEIQLAPPPPGWSATMAALNLPAGARVLIVPMPTAIRDSALRWIADDGQQISLIGGYFEGPDSTGRATIDGPGFPQLGCYLNYLWEAAYWNQAAFCPGPPPGRPADPWATLAYWRPTAVVAETAGKPALRRYLERLLGRPTVAYGSMTAWRLRWPKHRASSAGA
jgi:hypothetical protein